VRLGVEQRAHGLVDALTVEQPTDPPVDRPSQHVLSQVDRRRVVDQRRRSRRQPPGSAVRPVAPGGRSPSGVRRRLAAGTWSGDHGWTQVALSSTQSEKGGTGVQRDLRVSDAERAAVVRRLERALRDGRLTIVEFDERSQAAYAARTRGELEELTEDLPRDLW
jgi:Domain of unknown function (DUF1707)